MDKVEVDFSNKLATISMKAGKALTKEVLDKAFEGTKFKVTDFEQEAAKGIVEATHKATISGMT